MVKGRSEPPRTVAARLTPTIGHDGTRVQKHASRTQTPPGVWSSIVAAEEPVGPLSEIDHNNAS